MKIVYDPKIVWTAKYLIIFNDDEFWDVFVNRSKDDILSSSVDVFIKPEIIWWSQDNDIDFFYVRHKAELFFLTEADAIAFKMRWG